MNEILRRKNMNKFFKRLALLLAVLMIVSMMPVQLFADNSVAGEGQSNGTGENSYLTISGIAGFEGRKFASFADAYKAIKPVLEGLCADDALGEGVATAGAFDALFTNRDENGNATLTYTISGNIVYDETDYANLLTMGRRASHYGNDRHLINFKFVGATGKEADTLTVNSNITLPYEWWGEKAVTSISFENLTITGSAPSGLYPSQPYFEGINFKVDNCNLKGIKIYNCSNVKGTYTITNSTLDGTGAPAKAYAIHLQGNETEPLTINISGNTISGYDRGINIDQNTANATISGNTISIKDAGRSCIQLSSLANVAIADNTLELTGGNAITLHEKLLTLTTAPAITVNGNTITGKGYLIYDDAVANSKAFTSDNLTLTIGTNTVASTVDTTKGVKGSKQSRLSETVATVVKEALTPAYVAKVNGVDYAPLAEAITKANGNGTVTLLTATTELVQALLDGQYGSIDGLTIELPAGDYGKLELGRATKYAGSNTEYFVGGFDSTDKNYEAFTNADGIREYKGQSTWTPNCFYRRALKNVTIKAADGATVTIEKISADAGQIYGKADAPKYDYVLDVEIPDTNKSYYMALAWNNVTFEGINFKSSVNIESSSEKTLIDGLHFEKCNFNSGYTALAAANDANKASKGMGIRFVSWTETKNNLRNLTVNNCTFEDCYEGVYTNPVYGVSVTNSSFNNINHNAVAIQDVDSAVNHGNVVISGNKFTNVSDRIIRFNNAGEDTTITITGNTSVNSGDSAGEIIKATTMPDSVKINMTSNTWGDVNGKTAVLGNGFKPTSAAVATVGGVEYTTLAEAIAALNSTNHTLTLIDASVWDAATPVYWQAGAQSGYAAKLTDALTAAYKANAGDITIVCRPGADVGTMTHGHVADNLTVYGNNAYISGGECDLEVDTCMFSRVTGAQATDGVYLNKDITITAYELDNLGVWGQRHTDYTINISLNDCDGKAIEGKANVQRVYISGTTGVNNITVVGCDFLTKATALYSNADGEITIDNCSFAGSQVPVNFNHKANGTQTVTVKNSTFTNCGDKGEWKQFAAPVRFVNSGSGTLTATVDNCTFTETVGANGDILLGDGRNGEASNDVALTVTNTAATVVAQRPGYYNGETTDTTKAASKGVTASETFKTSIDEMVVINVTGYVEDESGNVTISDEEGLFWFAKQVNSGNTFKGKTVKLANDITLTKTWTPVGVSVPNSFQGTFDGDGHSIVGMGADCANQEYGLGFFKLVISATIKNVTFEKASVTGIYSNVVGIVSGYSYGSSTFENVHVVDSTVYAFGKVGGMVGMAEDRGATTTFKNCSVTGTTIHGGYNVAGFLGLVMGKCNISGSYLANNNIIIDENSYGFGKVTELDTAVTCDGSVDTCAGNGMVIRGRYIPNGEYYYSAYSDLYNHYGASSHDCTLTNGKYLANSEVVHDAPVKIGDVLYSDLQAAVDAVKSDEIITLLDDVDLDTDELSTYDVKSTVKNVTIDLGGHTLTSAYKYTIYLKVNDWTIQNGTITNTNASTTYGTLYIGGSYNSTTLKNVTIESKTNGVYFAIASNKNGIKTSITVEDGTKISGNYGVYMKGQPKPWGKTRDGQEILNVNGGEITGKIAAIAVFGAAKGNTKAGVIVNINGGKVYSEGYAIAGNGSTLLENTTININGGSVISTKDTAIYHPQAGTVNVTGGTVSGVTGGIQMCAGTLNVTGGTITATGNGDVSGKTGDGSIPDGAAVSIVNRGYPAGAPTAAISGGVLTSAKNVDAVQAYEWSSGAKAEWSNPNASVSGGKFTSAVPEEYCADGFIPTQNADGTYGVKEAMKGSKKNPYNLAELSEMTRAKYIAAQEALGCTMYVEIGDYSYDKNGVLGNGVRNDTPGQTEDRSVLNGYNSNGYLGENNDGANGKNIIFVGGSVTSGVTGYTSIDNIGTSLLLAVPAYTNVTFEGVTFENVMSFDYQLYTGPWSQLGKLKFDNCKFNGLIVGAIASQTLTFNKCTFTNYINTISANNSNPTWIRPAYGNWTQGDNEGQGSDFKSLTTINFTNNKVTSTRPVKFERIAQWEMDTKVSVKNNEVTISAQKGDTSTKSVGFYFGANAKFDLTLDGNKKLGATSALYTAVYKAPNGTDYAGLPAGSTVKDSKGADVEVAGVIWKSTDALTLKTTTEAVELVNSKSISVKFATLEEAFAAAKNSDTITLLSDVELSSTIVIKDVMNVTLDLNGKKLSTTTKTGDATRHYYAIDNYGTFTLRDSSAEQSGEIRARGIENLGTGTMTIESGKIVAIDANGGAAIWNNANLTINGGTFVAEHVGASSDQYGPGCVYNNGTLTINGGTFTSANKRTYAIVSKAGTVTITPADGKNVTISGAHGGLGIDGGTAIINGGSYASSDYYGLYVSNDAGTADVTVNGGTFTGKKYSVLIGSDGSSSVTSTLKIKGGTFDMPIHAQENTIDGAIAISGGKFKFKVDDKYFANGHVCSGTPGADGYYTIADHPIESFGVTIGEGLSLRLYVRDEYRNGKLLVKYTTVGSNPEVEYEAKISSVIEKVDGVATIRYCARIFGITPQMADVIIKVQYVDENDVAIGSEKEVSILKYCHNYVKEDSPEAVKTFVSKMLEYCASAMDYRMVTNEDQIYLGYTWKQRADALRAEKVDICGEDKVKYEFDLKKLGTYTNIGTTFKTRGMVYDNIIRIYFAIPSAEFNPGYKYYMNSNEIHPAYNEAKDQWEFSFTIAPYEYCNSIRITIKDGEDEIGEYACSLAIILESFSRKSGDAETDALAKLSVAAYEYCRSLADYPTSKDFNQ